MGSRTGSIMVISIECEEKNDIFILYSDITSSLQDGVNRISVNHHILEIYLSDNSFEQQKVIVNQVKQFMRDNEIKYTMEMR